MSPMPPREYPEIEHRVGYRLGEPLRALFDEAYRLRPEQPASAFWALRVYLEWLPPANLAPDDLRVPTMTPDNVLAFGVTAGDLHHFGFLIEPGDERALSERRVVYIEKNWPPASVIAPDLITFLSLVAMAGASTMRRTSSDDDWRRDWEADYRGDLEGLAEIKRAIAGLHLIPGVRSLERPSEIVRATPDAIFDLENPEPPPFKVHPEP